MKKKEISFKNSKGLILSGCMYEPKEYDTAVVFCHGFPSDASGHTARRIGPSLSGLGHLVLCFNFSHNPGSYEKFENKLMSQEVEDIKYAINFLEKNYSFKKLILIGHSTGAIDVALYAYSDKRVSKVILSGAVADLKTAVHYDFADYQIRDFWSKGYIIYANERGKRAKGQKIKKAFYDEFFKLDIPRSIKKYHRPLLIIYGEKDGSFDKEAKALYKIANKPKHLVMIKNAEHQFSRPSEWKGAVKAMNDFIKK